MNKLLLYLVEHLSFLYEVYGAEIIASRLRPDGPNAELILKYKNLYLKLTRDRNRIFIDFGSPNCANQNNWYSVNIVARLVTGHVVEMVQSDDDRLIFVQENFEKIEEFFSLDRIECSEKRMVKFEAERTASMFGVGLGNL